MKTVLYFPFAGKPANSLQTAHTVLYRNSFRIINISSIQTALNGRRVSKGFLNLFNKHRNVRLLNKHGTGVNIASLNGVTFHYTFECLHWT